MTLVSRVPTTLLAPQDTCSVHTTGYVLCSSRITTASRDVMTPNRTGGAGGETGAYACPSQHRHNSPATPYTCPASPWSSIHDRSLNCRSSNSYSGSSQPAIHGGVLDVLEEDIVCIDLPRDMAHHLQGATVAVARVIKMQGASVKVEVLVEEEEDVWMQPDQSVVLTLPSSSIVCVLDALYGQRQDRDSNPHGEHAHDVWQVLGPLDRGVYKGPKSVKVIDRDALV